MTIGAICNQDVVYVTRDVTVRAASQLMRQHHVGSLVVDEADGKRMPVGILTDRDIVVEIDAMDLDAKVITAGDIMAPELITAPASLGVLETIELMRVKGVRRMPIVDADHCLIGIVTIDDLLEVLAEELADIAHIVSREQSHERQLRK